MWARRQWLTSTHGDEGLERLIGVVSPAGRHLLRSEIDPKAWYNYPLFIELAIEMDKLFGDGDGKLNIEVARASAHTATRTIYQMFIRLGSVSWVLSRASKLWLEHFTRGAFIVTTEKHATFAEAEIADFPFPHLCHTYAVLGFAIGCVEMSGESNVRGEVVSCRSHGADKTILRVHWGGET